VPVHKIVRRADGVLVVLDDDERVADVAQAAQGVEQLVVVALVEADGGLVEDVEHAHQARADLRGEADALALAARERRARARERQVGEADRLEKTEPRADLAEDLLGDDRRAALELQAVHERERLGHGQVAEVRDAHAADRDRAGHLAQPLAAAGGAGLGGHALLELLADGVGLRLVIAPLDVGQNALERLLERAAAVAALVVEGELFGPGAVEHDAFRLVGQLAERRREREAVFFAQRLEVHAGDRVVPHAAPAGDLQAAVHDRERLVGHDELGVGHELEAEARADRARAVGVVEGEHARRELGHGDAAVLAGIVLREGRLAAVVHALDDDEAAGVADGRLDRVGQAAREVGLHHEAVDDDFDIVLLVLVELDGLAQVVDAAVGAHAGEAAVPGVVEHLFVLALFAADHRREHLKLRALGQGHHAVDDLVDRLAADLLSALRAVRHARARPEEAQVVVDLRDGADRGAGVLRGGFLVDGDGGGEAVDVVDVRLVHLAEELAGIGGKGLDVAPLALGIDGVEGEGRLARAGKSRKYDELVAGDGDVDVFEVVLARPPDGDGVLHGDLLGSRRCRVNHYIIARPAPRYNRKAAGGIFIPPRRMEKAGAKAPAAIFTARARAARRARRRSSPPRGPREIPGCGSPSPR